MPHVYVLLISLTIVVALASWVLPAGEFKREMSEAVHRTVVVPGSYAPVESTPVGPFQTFIAIQKGMIDAAAIVFFVFLAYASWFVVLETKALNAFIGWLLRLFDDKSDYILVVFVYVFGMMASVFGMFEETFGFIPLFVGMAIAMGYDAIVGLATVGLAIGIGYTAAVMNPFTVILAQNFSGLPFLSGWQFRIVTWVVMEALASWWIVRYARRIRKDPSSGYMMGLDMGDLQLDHDELVNTPFNAQNSAICGVVVVAIAILVWGVTQKGWYFNELVGTFVAMGVVCGFIGGFSPNKLADAYVRGFKDIVFGAMLIGLSRGVLIVLNEGHIIDTVVYYLSLPLQGLPRWLAAEGMLVVQNLINFVIPSGSGQAVVTMPIMAPLSDVLGISRQVAVLAFQFGDGLSNLMWPTALIPVMCAIAHVPLTKWYRFFVPFFLIALLFQGLFVAAAVALGVS
ncbi:MAG: C4-dicarboxylate ABC transporter [Dethiosulfovibrio peptidovorans]|nr:MAG: C4-dicarboxylate ABC transporter [Dethiosulfovibrio peptidovorans]